MVYDGDSTNCAPLCLYGFYCVDFGISDQTSGYDDDLCCGNLCTGVDGNRKSSGVYIRCF
ncbi:hypothetical protein D3C77_755480 [compost metagenome]